MNSSGRKIVAKSTDLREGLKSVPSLIIKLCRRQRGGLPAGEEEEGTSRGGVAGAGRGGAGTDSSAARPHHAAATHRHTTAAASPGSDIRVAVL
ncbi:hypothetical protein E2C01_058446 [Portunus trituberculatus]|uniref:Uncharacterized protein n=1 Tax=Portunus trituberculatus TaxID=210409 RepID=A0A5B7H2P5_PORTR|nr:hypothetical protein [Portunus trituberculatus]